jgi:hypothetical protein
MTRVIEKVIELLESEFGAAAKDPKTSIGKVVVYQKQLHNLFLQADRMISVICVKNFTMDYLEMIAARVIADRIICDLCYYSDDLNRCSYAPKYLRFTGNGFASCKLLSSSIILRLARQRKK